MYICIYVYTHTYTHTYLCITGTHAVFLWYACEHVCATAGLVCSYTLTGGPPPRFQFQTLIPKFQNLGKHVGPLPDNFHNRRCVANNEKLRHSGWKMHSNLEANLHIYVYMYYTYDYVYMCIYTHGYTYRFVSLCMSMYAYIYTYTHMFMHFQSLCTRTCIYIYIHMYI